MCENTQQSNFGSIVLYEDNDNSIHLDVRVENETVWLTQKQMAALFGRSVATISRHIKSAQEEELNGLSVVTFFATTGPDGKTYNVEHYNLDMIISVGYRVKSPEGVRFRRWANGVLKEHLVRGYTVNQTRLEALKTSIKVLSRSDVPEIAGAASIIERYIPSLQLLSGYDAGEVSEPKGDNPTWQLTYEDAIDFVQSLPFNEESNIFGRERDHQFEGIVNALYQGFAGEEIYPTVQAKAANLLYLVIKDHPFLDGNKRSAAALLIYFLEQNGLLHEGNTTIVEGNALAAMTLMVALSEPREKDMMVALIENFIAG